MDTTTTSRRLDLDWLRVLAILTVFVFHTGRFFDTAPWHVKNSVQYDGAMAWTSFLASWLMPLIFAISGASVYYALGARGAPTFLKDRALRLLVPLVVAIFTHAALQVYLERLTYHQFAGSFWAFYPHYFDGLYKGEGRNDGNFALFGMHLWYLLVLFVFSVVLLPLLAWLKRRPSGQRLYNLAGSGLAIPGVIYLLALPIVAAITLPDEGTLYGGRHFGGWNLVAHVQFFLYGFVVATHAGARRALERGRWVSLALGLLVTASAFAVQARVIRVPGLAPALAGDVLFGLNAWLWILALLGFGFRHLNVERPWRARLNEAVLPFYVLHQTVLLVVGFFVVQWPIPDGLKVVVIGAGSFALIAALYELVVRRSSVLRVLFGMKPLRQRLPVTRSPATAMQAPR